MPNRQSDAADSPACTLADRIVSEENGNDVSPEPAPDQDNDWRQILTDPAGRTTKRRHLLDRVQYLRPSAEAQAGRPGEAGHLNRLTLIGWRVANKRRGVWWSLRHRLRGTLARATWMPSKSRVGGSTWIQPAWASAAKPSAASCPLAVPAFDPRIWNPIRWQRAVGNEAAALGPVERLPPGIVAHHVVHRDDLLRLRRMHHVEDVQAFHADVTTRAGDLVRLAAGGVVVHLADGEVRLRAWLGDELYDVMTTDPSDFDAGTRELHSIRMRRIALRDHSRQAHTQQRGEEARPDPSPVSILLATRRPRFLPHALAAVARQTYPRLELVLALHGEGFDDVERRVAGVPHPTKVVRVAAREPLGAVLNVATAASSGTLLTKMDDDDLYGADHVWDLVLAHEYSQAQVVGKGVEFVYLAASDQTIHQLSGDGEHYRARTLAGGTLLVARHDLDRVGGWRQVQRGVDLGLIEDILRARGCVYRTHGAGFMLIRHGYRPVWDVSDERFLAQADLSFQGWIPALADAEGLIPPLSRTQGTGSHNPRELSNCSLPLPTVSRGRPEAG